jgi:hypothetical protein
MSDDDFIDLLMGFIGLALLVYLAAQVATMLMLILPRV